MVAATLRRRRRSRLYPHSPTWVFLGRNENKNAFGLGQLGLLVTETETEFCVIDQGMRCDAIRSMEYMNDKTRFFPEICDPPYLCMFVNDSPVRYPFGLLGLYQCSLLHYTQLH